MHDHLDILHRRCRTVGGARPQHVLPGLRETGGHFSRPVVGAGSWRVEGHRAGAAPDEPFHLQPIGDARTRRTLDLRDVDRRRRLAPLSNAGGPIARAPPRPRPAADSLGGSPSSVTVAVSVSVAGSATRGAPASVSVGGWFLRSPIVRRVPVPGGAISQSGRSHPTARSDLPVRDERPDHFLLSQVRRHRHREQLPVEAGIEVGRLAAIRSGRLDLVLGADRNRQFLDVIAIQVAEEQIEAAIGVLRPAFEDRLDGLARVVFDVAAERPSSAAAPAARSARWRCEYSGRMNRRIRSDMKPRSRRVRVADARVTVNTRRPFVPRVAGRCA